MSALARFLMGAAVVVIMMIVLFADPIVRQHLNFTAWLSLFLGVYVMGPLVWLAFKRSTIEAEQTAHRPILVAAGIVIVLSIGLGLHAIAMTIAASGPITCSMYHDAPFDDWWKENAWKYSGLSKDEFSRFPFPNGLTQPDGRLVNVSLDDIHIGDVLAFKSYDDGAIVGHRVVRKWIEHFNITRTRYVNKSAVRYIDTFNRTYFATFGDGAWAQMPYERRIGAEDVVGVVVPSSRDWLVDLLARKKCGALHYMT